MVQDDKERRDEHDRRGGPEGEDDPAGPSALASEPKTNSAARSVAASRCPIPPPTTSRPARTTAEWMTAAASANWRATPHRDVPGADGREAPGGDGGDPEEKQTMPAAARAQYPRPRCGAHRRGTRRSRSPAAIRRLPPPWGRRQRRLGRRGIGRGGVGVGTCGGRGHTWDRYGEGAGSGERIFIACSSAEGGWPAAGGPRLDTPHGAGDDRRASPHDRHTTALAPMPVR